MHHLRYLTLFIGILWVFPGLSWAQDRMAYVYEKSDLPPTLEELVRLPLAMYENHSAQGYFVVHDEVSQEWLEIALKNFDQVLRYYGFQYSSAKMTENGEFFWKLKNSEEVFKISITSESSLVDLSITYVERVNPSFHSADQLPEELLVPPSIYLECVRRKCEAIQYLGRENFQYYLQWIFQSFETSDAHSEELEEMMSHVVEYAADLVKEYENQNRVYASIALNIFKFKKFLNTSEARAFLAMFLGLEALENVFRPIAGTIGYDKGGVLGAVFGVFVFHQEFLTGSAYWFWKKIYPEISSKIEKWKHVDPDRLLGDRKLYETLAASRDQVVGMPLDHHILSTEIVISDPIRSESFVLVITDRSLPSGDSRIILSIQDLKQILSDRWLSEMLEIQSNGKVRVFVRLLFRSIEVRPEAKQRLIKCINELKKNSFYSDAQVKILPLPSHRFHSGENNTISSVFELLQEHELVFRQIQEDYSLSFNRFKNHLNRLPLEVEPISTWQSQTSREQRFRKDLKRNIEDVKKSVIRDISDIRKKAYPLAYRSLRVTNQVESQLIEDSFLDLMISWDNRMEYLRSFNFAMIHLSLIKNLTRHQISELMKPFFQMNISSNDIETPCRIFMTKRIDAL